MLLSHRHRYLFIHIAKTGGTSIRRVLGRGSWQEPLYWPTFLCSRVSRLCRHRLGSMIPRHAPALVAREMLPPELYRELFRFSFVRNPWDRLVSGYYHFCRERQDLLTRYRIRCFSEFVDWMLNEATDAMPRAALIRALRRPQYECLMDWHGQLLVDFVGRFECLEEDFRHVTERLRLPDLRLPHRRRSTGRADYRSMYDDVLAEQVGQTYAADVSTFRYAFDGACRHRVA